MWLGDTRHLLGLANYNRYLKKSKLQSSIKSMIEEARRIF